MQSQGTSGGFEGRVTRVASARLTNAVAASLAIAAFTVCLTLASAVIAIKVAMAMPIPT
jgi:hypothetical protein